MGLANGTKILCEKDVLQTDVPSFQDFPVLVQASPPSLSSVPPTPATDQVAYCLDLMCDLRSLGSARTDQICLRLCQRLAKRQSVALQAHPGCTKVCFILAVDFESGVPTEKASERKKRAATSRTQNYDLEAFEALVPDGIRCRGQAVEPLDMNRLMSTRSLRAAFYAYWRDWLERTHPPVWMRAPLWFDGGPGLVWHYDPSDAKVHSEPDALSSQAGEGEVGAVVWGLRAQQHNRAVWLWSGDTDLVVIALMHAPSMTVPWVVHFADRLYCDPVRVWRRWSSEAQSVGPCTRLLSLLSLGNDYVDKKLVLHGVHTDCVWLDEIANKIARRDGPIAASDSRRLDKASASSEKVCWSSPFELPSQAPQSLGAMGPSRLAIPPLKELPPQLSDEQRYEHWLRYLYTRELHRSKKSAAIGQRPWTVTEIERELVRRNAKRLVWPDAASQLACRIQLTFNWRYWATLHPRLQPRGPYGAWTQLAPAATAAAAAAKKNLKRERSDSGGRGGGRGRGRGSSGSYSRGSSSSSGIPGASVAAPVGAAVAASAAPAAAAPVGAAVAAPAPAAAVGAAVAAPAAAAAVGASAASDLILVAASEVADLQPPSAPPVELSQQMSHPGPEVKFDEPNHKYFAQKVPGGPFEGGLLSVSTLIGAYFPKFDPDVAVRSMKKGRNWHPGHKFWGQSDEAIKAAWTKNGAEASARGTTLHAVLEGEMNRRGLVRTDPVYRRLKEMKAFALWDAKHLTGAGLVPLCTEVRLLSEVQYWVAGTFDLVVVRDDHPPPSACNDTLSIHIKDWKFSVGIKGKPGDKINRWDSCGYGPCEHLGDANYSKYLLQQNFYCRFVEEMRGPWCWRGHTYQRVQVEAMSLAVFHPNHGPHGFLHLDLPRVPRVVAHLLEDRRLALVAGQTMEEYVAQHYMAKYQKAVQHSGGTMKEYMQKLYRSRMRELQDSR